MRKCQKRAESLYFLGNRETEFRVSETTVKDVKLKQLKEGIESTKMLIGNIKIKRNVYEQQLTEYELKLAEYEKEYNKLMEETE